MSAILNNLPIVIVGGVVITGAVLIWWYWDKIKNWVTGFIGDLWDGTKDIYNKAKDGVEKGWDTVKTGVEDGWKKTKDGVQEGWDKVSSGTNKAFNSTKDFVEKAADKTKWAFKNAGEDTAKFFKDEGENAKKKIEKAAASVFEEKHIKKAGQDIKKFFTNPLDGIQHPKSSSARQFNKTVNSAKKGVEKGLKWVKSLF